MYLDLIDRLHHDVGCEFLSDMRLDSRFNKIAKEKLQLFDVSEYPSWQWKDAIIYLSRHIP